MNLFSSLSNLQSLDLSNNKLEYLNETLFNPLKSLKTLNLSSNIKLKTLPTKLFTSLASLTQLDLSKCGLTRLDQSILKGLTKLEVIRLNGNPVALTNLTFVMNLCKLNNLKCKVIV